MQIALDAGYKFNNDFTIYYKDLKPFYYSAAIMSLMFKIDKAEFIVGARYMPFLSAVKPELGFNYYFKHNPESKFNYFLHTTVFYNNYSYNTKVGYENYNYHLTGIIPANYSEVRFQGFVQDIAFGIKMGFTSRLTADFIFGGGYFYGKRDFVQGNVLKAKTKDHYWGPTYTARFSLKYILKHQIKKEEGFEND
ncbi:MAG: hypothetical protein IAF38_18015 [Bacteroidia bacterium]|nr:hypothetical protein [Bacteroidia bacterium]